MLTIHLGKREYFNSETNEFEYEEGKLINFEYSLKVIYEWEGRWKKSFLKGGLTEQELIDFYKLMATEPIEEKHLTDEVIIEIAEYISQSNTATTFSSNGEDGKPTKLKHHTAEELYAMMFSASIPIEFENRNLSRLLIILRIINSFNEKPKKMSKQEIFKQNASLNAQRKAQMKTRG